ncbi:MAG: outer membrane lipoprotein carrier protein LolA [Deltaproteobacteria bacterium]|nr:outer membrane lipoprotein carrier protein LolA [Deltaproteobacteria bacterium]
MQRVQASIAFVLVTLVGLQVRAEGTDPTVVDRAVAGIEAFYNKVTDFKADFSQEVRRAHLARPLKKSGNVFFQRPAEGQPRMRWDYTQPDKVYYISDGEVLWSYEVQTKQAIKMAVKDSELYDSLKFLFGQGDLRASFDITAGPQKDGLVGLVLVPKSGQQDFKSLTLFARPETWEITRTELVDPLDNVSTITFSNVKYEPLKADGFKFTPPKGAQIQDLTQKLPNPPKPEKP